MRWLTFSMILALLLAANHFLLGELAQARPANFTRWLLDGQAGDADLVLLGSSAAYRGFDRALLGELLEARVVELSAVGTAYPEQHLILDLYLNRHRAGALIFEIDTWGFSSAGYSYPFHEYLYLPHLDHPAIRRHLEAHYGLRRLLAWRWFPMLKYAEFNLHLGFIPALKDLLTGRPFEHGQEHLFDTTFEPGTEDTPQNYDWLPARQQAFEDILDLAEKHKMDVTLVLAPVHASFAAREVDRNKVIDFYRRTAESRGIPLLMPEEPLVSDARLFHDATHLNRDGAALLTRRLARFLQVLETDG